ncbi:MULTISPECIES: hypothetical protein [unclassified Microcoleus]|uniref:hypothetical protein n=1 Tax=unclassified Microcoleus TaxID=2642155 RepID=UPI002FD16F13
MLRPKTDRPPPHPKVQRSYPSSEIAPIPTLSPNLFLKTMVSLVNSAILVVILLPKSIDQEAPCSA